jgi:hypothetical protein
MQHDAINPHLGPRLVTTRLVMEMNRLMLCGRNGNHNHGAAQISNTEHTCHDVAVAVPSAAKYCAHGTRADSNRQPDKKDMTYTAAAYCLKNLYDSGMPVCCSKHQNLWCNATEAVHTMILALHDGRCTRWPSWGQHAAQAKQHV